MQEPSDGTNLAGSGMSDKADKSCKYFKAGQAVAEMTFTAMRDQMLKEIEDVATNWNSVEKWENKSSLRML